MGGKDYSKQNKTITEGSLFLKFITITSLQLLRYSIFSLLNPCIAFISSQVIYLFLGFSFIVFLAPNYLCPGLPSGAQGIISGAGDQTD